MEVGYRGHVVSGGEEQWYSRVVENHCIRQYISHSITVLYQSQYHTVSCIIQYHTVSYTIQYQSQYHVSITVSITVSIKKYHISVNHSIMYQSQYQVSISITVSIIPTHIAQIPFPYLFPSIPFLFPFRTSSFITTSPCFTPTPLINPISISSGASTITSNLIGRPSGPIAKRCA